MPKGKENRISKRYLLPHVHCSFIHGSQDVKTVSAMPDGWMKEMWCVPVCLYSYLVEYYSAARKSEILPFATCAWSLSSVRLLAISWIGTYLAPLSMEFSRQESWSGLQFPSPVYNMDRPEGILLREIGWRKADTVRAHWFVESKQAETE